MLSRVPVRFLATSVEERIKRVLAADRAGRGGADEASRQRALTMPSLDPTLRAELAGLSRLTDHPAFWKVHGGVPLFERNARDCYYNFRVLMGSHGPTPSATVLHRLIDRCVCWRAPSPQP
jgi:hypothetical protein